MHHSSHSSNISPSKRSYNSYNHDNHDSRKRPRPSDDHTEGHGSLVANHYNSRKNTSKFERKSSKIY